MKDVLDQDLQLFLRHMLPDPDTLQQEMMAYAEEHHISIVEPEVGHLLQMLVKLLQPVHVLEIGTAIGFSTIFMAKALPAHGRLITIELVAERQQRACSYFARAGVENKIESIVDDARSWLPKFIEQSAETQTHTLFDLIFLDAAKGQYPDFLDMADKILKPGGLIIADNVLLNGWVVHFNYPERRKKTMVYRMKDFLESFKTNQAYQCSILPLGDGVALIRKEERAGQ